MNTIKKLKNCLHCKAEFECKSLKKKWCSTYCKNIQYNIKYPKKVKAQRLSWQRNNKDKIKEYLAVPTNRIAANLRSRLSKAIGRNQKTVSMSEYLGCSLQEVKDHLESKFEPGMTWDNYGEWHIDHIKPLILFDLSKTEEIKVACCYTNLQPLWAADNRKKSDHHG